jgi:hypothetical protein
MWNLLSSARPLVEYVFRPARSHHTSDLPCNWMRREMPSVHPGGASSAFHQVGRLGDSVLRRTF